ncbi:MAG: replication factor C large subunit [archaeon]|nr:replication factor C large subunit [archaeon]
MKQETLSEKYRIKKYSELIGQGKAVEEIKKFLKEFPKKKALILHGPAGTGKTSLALAAVRENNLEVLELNSSDLRNKAKLENILKPASIQQSLFKKGKIILMDEVDGVTGTDIGGIPELLKVIEITQYPIIMTCNDIWQSKLSPIRSKSKMVEMKALSLQDILSLLESISDKEKLRKSPNMLRQIALKAQGDIRAALNDLQSYSYGDDFIVNPMEKRDVEENIFVILKKLFKERKDFLDLFDTTSLSIDEIFLWIEENIPKEYKNESLAKAYQALSKADVFRGRIYKNQSWRFLLYQNAFQSAGISYAKPYPLAGFTLYTKPKRVLKIWMHNQKTIQKKSISKKYARMVHCSVKRVMRDFDLLRPILQRIKVQNQMNLSEEEIEFLSK